MRIKSVLLHYHDSLEMTLECRTAQNSSEDDRTIVFDLTKKNMQELYVLFLTYFDMQIFEWECLFIILSNYTRF